MKTKEDLKNIARIIIALFVFTGFTLKESEICLLVLLKANKKTQEEEE